MPMGNRKTAGGKDYRGRARCTHRCCRRHGSLELLREGREPRTTNCAPPHTLMFGVTQQTQISNAPKWSHLLTLPTSIRQTSVLFGAKHSTIKANHIIEPCTLYRTVIHLKRCYVDAPYITLFLFHCHRLWTHAFTTREPSRSWPSRFLSHILSTRTV